MRLWSDGCKGTTFFLSAQGGRRGYCAGFHEGSGGLLSLLSLTAAGLSRPGCGLRTGGSTADDGEGKKKEKYGADIGNFKKKT